MESVMEFVEQGEEKNVVNHMTLNQFGMVAKIVHEKIVKHASWKTVSQKKHII